MFKLAMLGLNSSNTATVAAAAASMLLQLPRLPAAEVVELLYTAIQRHAANNALKHMSAAMHHVQQPWQLSGDQLLPVLQHAVAVHTQPSKHAQPVFRYLGDLNRALPVSSISADSVAGLLHTALEVGSDIHCFDWLSGLPTFSRHRQIAAD